jgi:hypothetical protein
MLKRQKMERKREHFGRREPHSIRYTSTSEEFHKGELEKRKTRTLDIPKLQHIPMWIFVAIMVVVAAPESRAFAKESVALAFEMSKNWLLKGTLSIK